jgi:hypothetical protein
MHNLLIRTTAVLLIFIASCKKNDTTEPTPVTNTTFDVTKGTLQKQGTFMGKNNYTVNGIVKHYLYNGKNYLQFTNFSSSNGPDLKVYIATDATAATFITLGTLQSTTLATQVYEVTMPPNFTTHNKVLIWCQRFSVLFAEATLN